MATDGRPLFVMHIPKTAGTSFAWLVKQQYPATDVCTVYPGHLEQILSARDWIRAAPSPRAVIGHFRFGLHDGIVPAARYVTLVRDPVDQVLSNYNYIVGSDDPLHQAVVHPGTGIDEFVDHDWAGNLQTQFLVNKSRAEVEADPDGTYRLALETLDAHFVGIGTVELLAESVRRIARCLGWRVPAVPRLNTTPNRPGRMHRRDLSPATVARIVAANECDAKLHAYVTRVVQTAGDRRPNRFHLATKRLLGRLSPV